jgi:transcriptional regulator with XRE-family HTH domain
MPEHDEQWMLGQNITRLRRALRLNQTQLGDHPELLVTRQTISRWETGESMPERRHLRALAAIFGVTTDQLFDPPPPPKPKPATKR